MNAVMMLINSAAAVVCESAVPARFTSLDQDQEMYRSVVEMGEFSTTNLVLTSRIENVPADVYFWGLLFVSDEPFYDFGPSGVTGTYRSLPEYKVTVKIAGLDGQDVAAFEFSGAEVEYRDSSFRGRPNRRFQELPGQYQNIALLRGNDQARLRIAASDNLCFSSSMEISGPIPNGIRVFLIGFAPGWKLGTID